MSHQICIPGPLPDLDAQSLTLPGSRSAGADPWTLSPAIFPQGGENVEPRVRVAGISSNQVAGKLQRQLQSLSFLEATELELALPASDDNDDDDGKD